MNDFDPNDFTAEKDLLMEITSQLSQKKLISELKIDIASLKYDIYYALISLYARVRLWPDRSIDTKDVVKKLRSVVDANFDNWVDQAILVCNPYAFLQRAKNLPVANQESYTDERFEYYYNYVEMRFFLSEIKARQVEAKNLFTQYKILKDFLLKNAEKYFDILMDASATFNDYNIDWEEPDLHVVDYNSLFELLSQNPDQQFYICDYPYVFYFKQKELSIACVSKNPETSNNWFIDIQGHRYEIGEFFKLDNSSQSERIDIINELNEDFGLWYVK